MSVDQADIVDAKATKMEELLAELKNATAEEADDDRDLVEHILNKAIAIVRDPASAHISFDALAQRLANLRDSITGRNQEAPAAETVIIGQPEPASSEAEAAAEEVPAEETSSEAGESEKVEEPGGEPSEAEGQKAEEAGESSEQEGGESTSEQAPSDLGTTAT